MESSDASQAEFQKPTAVAATGHRVLVSRRRRVLGVESGNEFSSRYGRLSASEVLRRGAAGRLKESQQLIKMSGDGEMSCGFPVSIKDM